MTGEHKAAAPAAIEPPSPTSIADNDVARAIDLVARVKREFFSPRATGGTLYYPAFGLGVFPTYRAALAAIRFPLHEADAWESEHGGRVVTMALRESAEIQVLIRPQGGGAEVSYLFGRGFAQLDEAEAVAADCMASGWPERGEAHRWGVICRTRGALQ